MTDANFPRFRRPRAAPTLRTDRLVLRPMALDDWPAYRDALTGPRAVHMGGPFAPTVAWGMFCSDVAGWQLTGAGALTVETRQGSVVGQVGLNDIPAFPEPELGWLLFDGHEGRGYATEAAAACLDWIRTEIAPASLVSYVSAENDRSAAVARRLGARLDAAAERPAAGDLVFRHLGGRARMSGATAAEAGAR